MAQGTPCKCEIKDKLNWRIVHYKCNYSYFEQPKGCWHSSDYSEITCLKCGSFWRTKAKYVDELELLVVKDGKYY